MCIVGIVTNHRSKIENRSCSWAALTLAGQAQFLNDFIYVQLLLELCFHLKIANRKQCFATSLDLPETIAELLLIGAISLLQRFTCVLVKQRLSKAAYGSARSAHA